jgi:hypothetical protein
LKVACLRKSGGFFRNKYVTIISGFIGGGMTVFGIAFTFVPSSNISAIFTYELKLIFSCIGFLIPALVFYRINLRKLKVGEVVNKSFVIALSHNPYLYHNHHLNLAPHLIPPLTSFENFPMF